MECECHSGVNQPVHRLKENAQPKKEGADPTSFCTSHLDTQIWFLTHCFCLTRASAAKLVTELPLDVPLHRETGQLEMS